MLLRLTAIASMLLLTFGAALKLHAAEEVRTFSFDYSASIATPEAGAGPVHVFIPLAAETDQQRVVAEKILASIPGEVEVEDAYGNRYWHGSLEQSDGSPVAVTITTTVERRGSRLVTPAGETPALSAALREEFARFLESNARVLVDDPILQPILAEVRAAAGSDDPAILGRAIYDWVVDNVEYKKVGTGWGNGDTYWACNERYGNCTDFHALFISLARTESIPARFEIGFPVPTDRAEGEIGGYHCWVQYYLPGIGWFPIDASEAFKDPSKREFYYGSHPTDRIHFSTGRDLQLGAAHRGAPLNYFIYPHVEVNGKLWQGAVERKFSYRQLTDGALADAR
jgi:hypothetical protein